MAFAFNLGGTIALTYVDGVPLPVSGSDVLAGRPLQLIEIEPVQSYALEWAHLTRLRDEIVTAYGAGERQFLVLTGTDSAEDVTYFLEMVRPPEARVIVMVAMRTASAADPRPEGLEQAVRWLADAPPGIALCWGEHITEGCLPEKVWEHRWYFKSVHWLEDLKEWRVDPHLPLSRTMPVVPILACGIGSSGWHREVLGHRAFDGLVVEAFASGDVPPESAEQLVQLASQGVPVVLASRSRPGRIKAGFPGLVGTSHDLLSQGLIGAAQLDPHRARLRLALALACGARAEIEQAFAAK